MTYIQYIFSSVVIILIFTATVSARTYEYSILIPNDFKQLKITRCVSNKFRNDTIQLNTLEKQALNQVTKIQNKGDYLEYQPRLTSAVKRRLKGISTNFNRSGAMVSVSRQLFIFADNLKFDNMPEHKSVF